MLKCGVRIKIAPIIGINFFLVGLNVISLSSVIYGAKIEVQIENTTTHYKYFLRNTIYN